MILSREEMDELDKLPANFALIALTKFRWVTNSRNGFMVQSNWHYTMQEAVKEALEKAVPAVRNHIHHGWPLPWAEITMLDEYDCHEATLLSTDFEALPSKIKGLAK